MIEPTVGRIVWYRPGGANGPKHAAIIADVHGDNCVNLAIFGADGWAYNRVSVFLKQGEGDQSGPYAEWMPYQKGQAAKTEELEKQLAEAPTIQP